MSRKSQESVFASLNDLPQLRPSSTLASAPVLQYTPLDELAADLRQHKRDLGGELRFLDIAGAQDSLEAAAVELMEFQKLRQRLNAAMGPDLVRQAKAHQALREWAGLVEPRDPTPDDIRCALGLGPDEPLPTGDVANVGGG